MHTKKIKLALAAALALCLGSCADMGFGVDVDSGAYSPYLYDGTGYYGGPVYSPWYGYNSWNSPWIDTNPGPALPPPPLINSGPAWRPVNPGYNPPARPTVRPGVITNGGTGGSAAGVTGTPLIPGAGNGTRPGNGGMPNNPR